MTRKHTRFTGILEGMSNKAVGRYLRDKIKELPVETQKLAVEKLSEVAPKHLKAMVIKSKNAVGCRWFLRYHFAFGKRVRGLLNDFVCNESETPEGNWEFYYSQLVEMALDLYD